MESSKVSTRKVNQIVTTIDYYLNDISQEEIKGTVWGAYNAITGYYSNCSTLEGEKRMDSLLWGGANKAMNEALAYAHDIVFEHAAV